MKPFPLLKRLLHLTRGKALVDIDIKTSHLKPINDVVQKTNTVEQVFYFDSDYDGLRSSIREMEPNSIFMPRAYSSKWQIQR